GIIIGNGDGTFKAPVGYASGGQPVYVATGDFNGDGKLDLTAGTQLARMAFYPGNGDGTFGASMQMNGFSGNASGIALADFDGDGKLDQAVASTGNTAEILR